MPLAPPVINATLPSSLSNTSRIVYYHFVCKEKEKDDYYKTKLLNENLLAIGDGRE